MSEQKIPKKLKAAIHCLQMKPGETIGASKECINRLTALTN